VCVQELLEKRTLAAHWLACAGSVKTMMMMMMMMPAHNTLFWWF
jgi:hypothetical protein